MEDPRIECSTGQVVPRVMRKEGLEGGAVPGRTCFEAIVAEIENIWSTAVALVNII